MSKLRYLLLTLLLCVPSLQAADSSQAADQTRALIAELLNNVDWQLLMQVQQNLLSNLELLVPYTQEYLQCLESEGLIGPDQNADLATLIEQAGKASGQCKVIVQSLLGQLDFNISREEFEQGLSPEYRELLKKSL